MAEETKAKAPKLVDPALQAKLEAEAKAKAEADAKAKADAEAKAKADAEAKAKADAAKREAEEDALRQKRTSYFASSPREVCSLRISSRRSVLQKQGYASPL